MDNSCKQSLSLQRKLNYILIEINDDGDFKNKRIVLAEALLDSVVKDCNIKILKI